MPRRFDKRERDEMRSALIESGPIKLAKKPDPEKEKPKTQNDEGASVLDALEETDDRKFASKTAAGQCPECGGPSSYQGERNGKVYYKCRKCGLDHSSQPGQKPRGEFQDFEEELGDKLMPHSKVAGTTCQYCGTPVPYAGAGNQYCPKCHAEYDPYGRPLSPPPQQAQGHPRAGEPLSGLDMPAAYARWGNVARVAQGEASVPPEEGWQQKPTADPYNPAAYESLVGGGEDSSAHGNVGREAYQWAVQEGATPQAAAEQARAKEQAALHQGLQGQHPTNMYQVQGSHEAHEDFGPVVGCPACGGLGMPLGQLGRRFHYRCRNCGMDFSHEEHPDDVAAREQDMVEQDPSYHEHYHGSADFVPESVIQRISHLLS
jgi:predicted RNA-binding Zn-ribbon protein involved in translation (DUF1610 family)